jgi:hypothetical protein
MPESSLLAWVVRVAEALARAEVPHALAGGLALAVHGHPRATTDVDFVIAEDPAAIARARAALEAQGILQTRRPIIAFKRISMLRVIAAPESSPEPISIDLLIAPRALDVLARASSIAAGDSEVSVVSPEDLVLLKLLRASDQDILDIRALASDHALDRAYLARAAKALRITARLTRALATSRASKPATRKRGKRARSRSSRGRRPH